MNLKASHCCICEKSICIFFVKIELENVRMVGLPTNKVAIMSTVRGNRISVLLSDV